MQQYLKEDVLDLELAKQDLLSWLGTDDYVDGKSWHSHNDMYPTRKAKSVQPAQDLAHHPSGLHRTLIISSDMQRCICTAGELDISTSAVQATCLLVKLASSNLHQQSL